MPVPIIIAVDPGRDKCGLALVTETGQVEDLRIVARAQVAATVRDIAQRQEVAALLVGDGTGGAEVRAELEALKLSVPARSVPERDTTLKARERYFVHNPPRGWRSLIPRGLLLPPRPVDDYAALVMAEQWLEGEQGDGDAS